MGPDALNYRFLPMTASACREIESWRYPAPYDFYDLDADLDDLKEFTDEQNWPEAYFGVYTDDGSLASSFVYERKGSTAIVGLGMRPDLTGMGLGTPFVAAGLAFGAEHLGVDQYELAVAAFNKRAINVYKRLGFNVVEEFQQATNGGTFPFLRMWGPAVRQGACIMMVDRRSRVAMQLRDNKPHVGSADCWGLFGGMIEPDEQPAVTIIREMKEELTIDLCRDRLTLVKRLTSPRGIQSHVFLYRLSDELDGARLLEGQRFELVGDADIKDGQVQGEQVIPYQLEILREFWDGQLR